MAACKTTSVVTHSPANPSAIVQRFISTSERHLCVAIVPTNTVKNMRWLLRYAHHCRVQLDARQPEANALRGQFTTAAWRLMCRSNRDCFLPILRNRKLGFKCLVRYAQALAQSGFQITPNHDLLAYLIQSSYYFFNQTPEAPSSKSEIVLLRLATRHGTVGRMDFMRVHAWQGHGRGAVTPHMTWASVLRRANAWHQRQRLLVNHVKTGCSEYLPAKWQFACGPANWQEYEIVPLVNEVAVWDEAQAMASCLYQLRHICNKNTSPSRFFSVRKDGRRHATLELVCNQQYPPKHEPRQRTLRWQLQDCRLSHNRLPSDALVQALTGFAAHYTNLSQQPRQHQTELPACEHSALI